MGVLGFEMDWSLVVIAFKGAVWTREWGINWCVGAYWDRG